MTSERFRDSRYWRVEQMIQDQLAAIEAAIAAIRAELTPVVSAQKPPLPNVIPIVDCLWPNAMMKDQQRTYYGNVVDGLLEWRGVVDSVIVVTKPGNDLFERLDGFNPDIIPGYKSVDIVKYAFDWSGWVTFFASVASLVNERKPPRMLIDIEATIKDYVLNGMGEPSIRVVEQFGSMLHTLPCEFWVYPPPYWPGRDAGCQSRLRDIVKALDGPNVRFISQRYQSPAATKDARFTEADQWAVDNLTNTDFPEQVFFYGTDAYWPDDRFVECLQLIADKLGPDTDVLVYPGHARFVEASKVLAAALKEAKA